MSRLVSSSTAGPVSALELLGLIGSIHLNVWIEESGLTSLIGRIGLRNVIGWIGLNCLRLD